MCTATCEQIQSGNVVFLDGSTTGNITFNQDCTADAKCAIDNQMEALITQVQDLKQTNATSASLFPNFGSVNLNNGTQEIANEVRNIISNTCSADVTQIQSNNMVYARNSTTGDIGFTQNGSATADCILNNIARATLNLNQTGAQSNAVSGFAIGGIIAIIIIVIIIGVVARAANKGKSNQDSGGGGQSNNQAKSNQSSSNNPSGGNSSSSPNTT